MEFFIVFEGEIKQEPTLKLINAILAAINEGIYEKINIFFSSLGGSIYEGFIIANVIQNSKIPIAMHAVNHIDSIANVVFLAAKERTAESHAKFFLHGASVNLASADEGTLLEHLSSVRTHNSRIAYFISENSTIPLQKVQDLMRKRTTLSAQQALKEGIVSQIAHKEMNSTDPRNEIVYVT